MTSDQAVVAALRAQRIELPSWAFGNSGTRFKVFAQQGVPRDPYEKIADAAQVHRYTGVAPTVALHIPWDKVDDYADLAPPRRGAAASPSGRSTRTRSRTTTTCSAASATRTRGSAARPSTTCSSASTSWTRPGRATSSCGSRTGPTTRARTTSAPARTASPRRSPTVYARLGPDQRMVLEYKLFEPSFYTTDVPDWGTALVHCVALGPKAKVVVDTGHHAPGHEHRVHRRVAAARRQARRVRLQLAVLRRRRPDGRLGRPVPAVPDHARGRAGGRARARRRASRSCSTSATTSSPRSRARSAR